MRKSIAREISVIFVGLVVLLVGSYLLINNVFLEKFYVLKMEKLLISSYEEINENITDLSDIDEDFAEQFENTARANGMVFLVLSTSYEQPWTNVQRKHEHDAMTAKLNGYNLSIDGSEAEILKKTDTYTIQKENDGMMSTEYLEIWGELTVGYFFLRIPLESIKTGARISNEFILYLSIGAIIISIILVMWLSNRITKPLKELTELSKRMADLEFDTRYESGGENEIGQLGASFNKMSKILESTISQLKAANIELQRDIEKKEELDEMRKEFFANASHELKTPLALIQGYAEGLAEGISDDPESRQFYCEVIMEEAGKMSTMVGKMLTLSQLESGQEKLQIERFDLSLLISGKIQSMQMLAQQKEAVITYEGPEELPVWGDEFKIEEVLTNFLSNALNHVDGERRIVVSTRKEGNIVRTSVFNTGSPIPREDLEKLWIKFYKVDKARTRAYGGSGVGLSIVKAIMDSLHQKCGVQNEENGVTFWFELDGGEADKRTEEITEEI